MHSPLKLLQLSFNILYMHLTVKSFFCKSNFQKVILAAILNHSFYVAELRSNSSILTLNRFGNSFQNVLCVIFVQMLNTVQLQFKITPKVIKMNTFQELLLCPQ